MKRTNRKLLVFRNEMKVWWGTVWRKHQLVLLQALGKCIGDSVQLEVVFKERF